MSRLYIREIDTCQFCGHRHSLSYNLYHHCTLSDKELPKTFMKKIPKWCKLEKVKIKEVE